jgi:hypothetical protein
VALGEDFTDFILSNVPHRSIVTGVEYAGRQEAAAQVAVNDLLDLEAEDNRYDPYAIRVLFQGQHLGYLQRDIARVVFKELKYGHEFQTRVISLLIGNDGDDRVIGIEVETQRIK